MTSAEVQPKRVDLNSGIPIFLLWLLYSHKQQLPVYGNKRQLQILTEAERKFSV